MRPISILPLASVIAMAPALGLGDDTTLRAPGGLDVSPTAASPSAAPSGAGADLSDLLAEEVVLLTNGNAIRGAVQRGQTHCVIEMVRGATMRLPWDEIEYVGPSLEAAYEYKRSLVDPQDAMDRLRLTYWCINNGLLAQAEKELSLAVGLAPDHEGIAPLTRRLEMAKQLEVLKAKHDAEPAPTVAARAAARRRDTPEVDLATLPKESLPTFSREVQPLLLNSCGVGACHGTMAKNDFRLVRPPVGAGVTRQLTARNIAAALEQVDYQDPVNSPLLTYAKRKHGSMDDPVFTDRQWEQYKRIVDWVYQTVPTSHSSSSFRAEVASAMSSDSASPRPTASPSGPPRGNASTTATASGPDAPASNPWLPDGRKVIQAGDPPPDRLRMTNPYMGVEQTSHEQDVPREQSTGTTSRGTDSASQRKKTIDAETLEEMRQAMIRSLESQDEVQRGQSVIDFTPRDPFDPEIFNREFHANDEKRKRKAKGLTAGADKADDAP